MPQESLMRLALCFFSSCLLAGLSLAASANGGGAMSMPSMPMPPRQASPQERARNAYNDGVRQVKKADKAQQASLEATDPGKKDKAAREAHEAYAAALKKFTESAGLDPTLHEAWNYVGYTNRKLGNYDDALVAYDKALAIKPGYPDALEYRGEAYLAMGRVPDAQQAYLDLYAGDRGLAGKLLTAMKSWAAAQRSNPSPASATNLDELDKWIQERSQIAAQTAALTRAGTIRSWH
jgi:tetratricopeptide (TPR) repeat protein